MRSFQVKMMNLMHKLTSTKILLYFYYLSNQIGRMPTRYDLSAYSPISNELNALIHKCCGLLQIYDRLESFFNRLSDKSSYEDQTFQSQMITLENIWIYVYFFLLANCFNSGVFLCEILIFHRKELLRTLTVAFQRCRIANAACWRAVFGNMCKMLRSLIFIIARCIITIVSCGRKLSTNMRVLFRPNRNKVNR